MMSYSTPTDAAVDLIDRYGSSAGSEAVMFGYELREIGDLDGWRFWQRVYEVLCQIELAETRPNTTIQ